MYDPLTYVYPRTMQQAFGPYAVLTIEEDEQMDYQDKIVVIFCALASVAVVVITAVEQLK